LTDGAVAIRCGRISADQEGWMPRKILIMGAAGRDFHNFNVLFRDNPDVEVVAFTATQIPGIEGRRYPPVLAGSRYPEGIPIHPESELVDLIRSHEVDAAVFSYSDVSHEAVGQKAARVNAAGADFVLASAEATMLASCKPVVSVCAVRTGCGKSPTTRKVAEALRAQGLKVAVVRHPMPYGDLSKQIVQRFGSYADLDLHQCTIEEREEYEQYVEMGIPIYAGVDYERILRAAEEEADVVIWDGGNNDTPFYAADLEIVVLDPLRAGHELRYYPGTTNLIRASVALINKVDRATPEQLETVRASLRAWNPEATVIEARSELDVDDASRVKGKRVLVVEDGPTLTHGEMGIGAGFVAAERLGAGEIVDPRPFAVGSIQAAYSRFPQLGLVLPALGYSDEQRAELEQTIARANVDTVIVATPIDLTRVVKIQQPTARVRYRVAEVSGPTIEQIMREFVASLA
jgi:predicted GTPase